MALSAGEDVTCTFSNSLQPGSLTIVKEASPKDGTNFGFISDIPGGTTFTLDDEASQTDAISQSITFNDLISDTYSITETLASGWQLDSASCTGGSDIGNLTDQTLSVTLGVGEDVVCTFSNSSIVIYLPIILKDFTPQPDLVVDDLVASSGGVTVTIRNAGTEAVENSFWVDVYFNPIQTPGLNQPWDTIAPAGVVWGVTATIPAGDSLTLTVGDAYYAAKWSSTPPFPTGVQVYAFVDSINYDTNYGNVWEIDEGNNLSNPPVTSTAGAAAILPLKGETPPATGLLPERE